jgi:hypothetical protein
MHKVIQAVSAYLFAILILENYKSWHTWFAFIVQGGVTQRLIIVNLDKDSYWTNSTMVLSKIEEYLDTLYHTINETQRFRNDLSVEDLNVLDNYVYVHGHFLEATKNVNNGSPQVALHAALADEKSTEAQPLEDRPRAITFFATTIPQT